MKKFLSLSLTFVLTLALALSIGCAQPKGGVNIKYYATAQDIVPLMMAGKENIGLIPEPAVTNLENAMAKQGKTVYKLDLQELYDSQAKAYPQAVLMVKKSVLTDELYNQLKTAITDSVAWAKENIATAVSALGDVTTLNASTLTASAIDGCKIYFESASEAKNSVVKYIDDIRSIESSSATAVTDDFFYSTASGSNFKESYTFACPDGAPAIAISKLINDGNKLGTDKTVNYNIVAANLIATQMSNGIADIMIMPVNAATKLYNKNADDTYACVAVITHGNFYIMSTEQISIDDLTDKQIAVPNMGAVPDWTIRKVLQNKGYTINVIE